MGTCCVANRSWYHKFPAVEHNYPGNVEAGNDVTGITDCGSVWIKLFIGVIKIDFCWLYMCLCDRWKQVNVFYTVEASVWHSTVTDVQYEQQKTNVFCKESRDGCGLEEGLHLEMRVMKWEVPGLSLRVKPSEPQHEKPPHFNLLPLPLWVQSLCIIYI